MPRTTRTPPSRRMLFALTPMALAALALPGACASDATPSDRPGAAPRTPVAPAPKRAHDNISPEQRAEYEAYARLGYRLAWRSSNLAGQDRRSRFFDAAGERLVFQDSGNVVSLLDASTGALRWSVQVDDPTARFVGNRIADDRVYCSSDNELFILDARSGEIAERHRLAHVVNTRPVITGRMAVFGCPSGEALGHSLASTYKLWAYRLRGAITAEPVLVPGGAGDGDAVAVVSQGGEVLIADARTGSSLGIGAIYSGLANTPVASADTLYIASTDQSIYAFDVQGARLKWRERTERPITDQPVLRADALFVAIPSRGLVQFDAATGAVRWTAKDVRGRVLGSRDGRLIVWDDESFTACVLDPANGDVIDRVTIDGVWRLTMDGADDGALYAANRWGRISKFTP